MSGRLRSWMSIQTRMRRLRRVAESLIQLKLNPALGKIRSVLWILTRDTRRLDLGNARLRRRILV